MAFHETYFFTASIRGVARKQFGVVLDLGSVGFPFDFGVFLCTVSGVEPGKPP